MIFLSSNVFRRQTPFLANQRCFLSPFCNRFNSSFHHPNSIIHGKRYEGIRSQELNDTPISKIDNQKIYQLGFARKTAFHITHSSLAFLDEGSEKKWLILGRQSRYFFVHHNPIKNFVRYFKIWEIFKTHIDNEKYYDLFKNTPFNIEMSTAGFYGSEIKEIVREADQFICHPQLYNGVISNCYSASILMLTKAIKILHERKDDKVKEQMMSIAQLLQKATQDNFSIGVCNNSVVTKTLNDIRSLTHENGFLK